MRELSQQLASLEQVDKKLSLEQTSKQSVFLCIQARASSQQKVWNEVENSERDWGAPRACEARALRARKTLTPHFTFLLILRKNRLFCSLSLKTPELAKKTCTQSAKQRSACLKFVKKFKSLTVEKGRDDYLFLDQCPTYFFSAAYCKNYIVQESNWLLQTR